MKKAKSSSDANCHKSQHKSGNANDPISLVLYIIGWKQLEVWIPTSISQVISAEMKQLLEQPVPLHSGNCPVHLQIPVPSSDLNKYVHFP